jgi:hypothetical protein
MATYPYQNVRVLGVCGIEAAQVPRTVAVLIRVTKSRVIITADSALDDTTHLIDNQIVFFTVDHTKPIAKVRLYNMRTKRTHSIRVAGIHQPCESVQVKPVGLQNMQAKQHKCVLVQHTQQIRKRHSNKMRMPRTSTFVSSFMSSDISTYASTSSSTSFSVSSDISKSDSTSSSTSFSVSSDISKSDSTSFSASSSTSSSAAVCLCFLALECDPLSPPWGISCQTIRRYKAWLTVMSRDEQTQ